MAWFDAFAKEYDEWYKSSLGERVDRIEKALVDEMAQPQKGERALDLGTGTGNFAVWLANKGLSVTGYDVSKEMLQEAKQKENAHYVCWMQGDAHHLPFPEASFDLIVSVTAIEFMSKPQVVLRDAMRLLKPGGRLVVGLLAEDSDWGALYNDKAKDPNDLFSQVTLYTEEKVNELLPMDYTLKKGLYIPPNPHLSEEEANKIEKDQQAKQGPHAGFYVVKWEKGE